ncbi:MAG: MFS transporter [Candidatus Micrarchaeaceae archaeon]
MPSWLNKGILLLSLSAFFADSGYQMLVAGLPLFIVFALKAPVYAYGIATALAYGVGSLFSYLGGVLSDKYSKKKIAIFGNALIATLSFTGMSSNAAEAISLFSIGWWFRNFRTPARRAMQSDLSKKEHRGKAFGFLHALDILGAVTASLILIFLLSLHLGFKYIFLISSIPIAISTILLFPVKEKKVRNEKARINRVVEASRINKKVFAGIIFSTALYGFSSYSLGFPILTISQRSSEANGIWAYILMTLVSAVAGFLIGSSKANKVRLLGILGYALGGVGSLLIGVAYEEILGKEMFYVAVSLIGISLGAIETLEPTIISIVSKAKEHGRSMGALTTSRSIGLFASNILMGLLYSIGPFYSYFYASILSITAFFVLIIFGMGYKERSAR